MLVMNGITASILDFLEKFTDKHVYYVYRNYLLNRTNFAYIKEYLLQCDRTI